MKMKDVFSVGLVIAALFLVFFRGAFVDKAEAVKALETQGYSNVQITSEAWLLVGVRGCAEQDAAKFSARATNPAGRQVELFVCVGWPFKGATVRSK